MRAEIKESRVIVACTICFLWYIFYILTHTCNYIFINISILYFSQSLSLWTVFFSSNCKYSLHFLINFFQLFYQLSFQLVIRDEQGDNVYENDGFTQTNTTKSWDEISRTSIELTKNVLVSGQFGVIVVEGKVRRSLLVSEPCSVKLLKGMYIACLKVVQKHSSTHIISTCSSIIFSTILKKKTFTSDYETDWTDPF